MFGALFFLLFEQMSHSAEKWTQSALQLMHAGTFCGNFGTHSSDALKTSFIEMPLWEVIDYFIMMFLHVPDVISLKLFPRQRSRFHLLIQMNVVDDNLWIIQAMKMSKGAPSYSRFSLFKQSCFLFSGVCPHLKEQTGDMSVSSSPAVYSPLPCWWVLLLSCVYSSSMHDVHMCIWRPLQINESNKTVSEY